MSEVDKKDAVTNRFHVIIDRLHDEIDQLKGELREANWKLDAIHEHQRNCDPSEREVWYWQGDGEDHPESMANSLLVVIRAGDLTDLLSDRQEQTPGLPDDFPSILLSAAKAHQRFSVAAHDNPQRYAQAVWHTLNELFIDQANDCDRDPIEILSEIIGNREITE